MSCADELQKMLRLFRQMTGQDIRRLELKEDNWCIDLEITTKRGHRFSMQHAFGEHMGEGPYMRLHMWIPESNMFLPLRTPENPAGYIFDKLTCTLGKEQLLF